MRSPDVGALIVKGTAGDTNMARIRGFKIVAAPVQGAVPSAEESRRRDLTARLSGTSTVSAVLPGVNFLLSARTFVRVGNDGVPDADIVIGIRTTTMHRAAKDVSVKSVLAILRAVAADKAADELETAAAELAATIETPLRAVPDEELKLLARSKKDGPAPEGAAE